MLGLGLVRVDCGSGAKGGGGRGHVRPAVKENAGRIGAERSREQSRKEQYFQSRAGKSSIFSHVHCYKLQYTAVHHHTLQYSALHSTTQN